MLYFSYIISCKKQQIINHNKKAPTPDFSKVSDCESASMSGWKTLEEQQHPQNVSCQVHHTFRDSLSPI